jgi:hypothetical protein
MTAATVVGRRAGPFAAGWVAALPAGLAVAVIAIGCDAGGAAARTMALGAATHVSARVAFALAFATVLSRRGLVQGLAAGTLAYAGVSLMLAEISHLVAVLAAIPALVLAPALMIRGRQPGGSAGGWRLMALTCALSTLLVAGTLLTSRLAGPAMAGAVAAFPALSGTLSTLTAAGAGARAGAAALAGLVRGLPCYLTFCALVVLLMPATGLPAVALALLGSLAAGHLTWRRIRPLSAVMAT